MKSRALHHIHQRKRVHQKLEPYPHSSPGIRFLDNLVLLVAIVGPFTAIPQIVKILVLKSAAGVSVSTWFLSTLLSVPWLIYGIVHKEKPIIVSSILWILFNGIVIVTALVYS